MIFSQCFVVGVLVDGARRLENLLQSGFQKVLTGSTVK